MPNIGTALSAEGACRPAPFFGVVVSKAFVSAWVDSRSMNLKFRERKWSRIRRIHNLKCSPSLCNRTFRDRVLIFWHAFVIIIEVSESVWWLELGSGNHPWLGIKSSTRIRWRRSALVRSWANVYTLEIITRFSYSNLWQLIQSRSCWEIFFALKSWWDWGSRPQYCS